MTVESSCSWYLGDSCELFFSFSSLLIMSPALFLLAEVEGDSRRSTLSEGSSCGKAIEILPCYNVSCYLQVEQSICWFLVLGEISLMPCNFTEKNEQTNHFGHLSFFAVVSATLLVLQGDSVFFLERVEKMLCIRVTMLSIFVMEKEKGFWGCFI